MQKEGLQAAIDFTKFLLTLAGGAIAFILQPSYFADSSLAFRGIGILGLIAFTVSAISGLFVFSAGCVMLANGNYDLDLPRIKWPGLVNVFSFGAGFLLLALEIGWKLINV
jgi:hypothetical protein